VVTTAADSKGVTEPPVSVASTGLKVLRFDTDPELQYLLAIRMVLVVLRTAVLAVAGNARRSLEWILPTSYRGRQEENAENRKYFQEEGSLVPGFGSKSYVPGYANTQGSFGPPDLKAESPFKLGSRLRHFNSSATLRRLEHRSSVRCH